MLSGPSSSGSAISCSTRLGRIMHHSVCKTTHRAIARGWAAPMQPDVRLSRAQVYSQAGICMNLSGLKKPMSTLEQGALVSCAVRVLSGHQPFLCEAAQSFQQLDALQSSRITCSWVMHICGGPDTLQLTAGPHLRPAVGTAFHSHLLLELYSQGTRQREQEYKATRSRSMAAAQQHETEPQADASEVEAEWSQLGLQVLCLQLPLCPEGVGKLLPCRLR